MGAPLTGPLSGFLCSCCGCCARSLRRSPLRRSRAGTGAPASAGGWQRCAGGDYESRRRGRCLTGRWEGAQRCCAPGEWALWLAPATFAQRALVESPSLRFRRGLAREVVVLWGRRVLPRSRDRRVWASTRGTVGRFSNPVALSEPVHEAGSPLTPAAAVGEGGSLTVVWSSETRSPAGLRRGGDRGGRPPSGRRIRPAGAAVPASGSAYSPGRRRPERGDGCAVSSELAHLRP